MKRKPVRQGDVLLVPCEASEVQGKPVERVGGRIIVAAGEVTGHHHAISDAEVEAFITEHEMYLVVEGAEAQLVHEEHGALALAPGAWKYVPQVEYDDADVRRVAD